MKTIDFSKAGGFLLEQEAFEMMQDAYRKDFFEAFARQTGLKRDQKYVVLQATATQQGWLSLDGELVPLEPADQKLPFFKVHEITSALRFGSGISEKIYRRKVAEYVASIPDPLPAPVETEEVRVVSEYYPIAEFESAVHLPDLPDLLMPVDGSRTMSGMLRLGGNKISKLDVSEHAESVIRAGKLLLGSSSQLVGDKPGIAVSDNTNSLTINEAFKWSKITLNGNLNFSSISVNPEQYDHPLLIDRDGNISGGDSNYFGGVPLGLILIWTAIEIPYGWILCDGNGGVQINGIEIPDLTSRFLGNTRYIIYVRRTNRPPENLTISGETNLIYQASASGAATTLSATAQDPDNDQLTYTWTREFGVIDNWQDQQGPELQLQDLTYGNYEFRVEATDEAGLSINQRVQLSVALQPEITLARDFPGEVTLLEGYTITAKGIPNAPVTLLTEMVENTAGGLVFVDILQVPETGIGEFPFTMDSSGELIILIAVEATLAGVIRANMKLKLGNAVSNEVSVVAINEPLIFPPNEINDLPPQDPLGDILLPGDLPDDPIITEE
ncbi:MAG: hypothetical protein AAFQ94_14340 [Bacteroidota bacterium]